MCTSGRPFFCCAELTLFYRWICALIVVELTGPCEKKEDMRIYSHAPKRRTQESSQFLFFLFAKWSLYSKTEKGAVLTNLSSFFFFLSPTLLVL